MEKSNSREVFLDLLRIIAAFFVIVNHTNSTIFLQNTPDSLRWYLSLAYFFVSKLAVPVFFMISGYLLLSQIDTWKKALKRAFRIFVALFTYSVVYSLYSNLYVNKITDISVIIDKIFKFYQKPPSTALWYLYAYIGILLMLPFLQKMVHMMEKKDYHIFFLITGIIVSVYPILVHYNSEFAYTTHFNAPLFSAFICMLLIGQYFKRFGIKKTKLGFCIALAVFVSMVILNVILTYYEYQKASTKYLFFDNVRLFPILLESISVFYMCSFAKFKPRTSSVISYVGACTFGIYLISDISIDFMKPMYLSLSEMIHPLIAVVIFEILVFLVGLVITALLKFIPGIKKYL